MLRNNILFLTETLTNYQYDFFDKFSYYQNIKVIVYNKKAYKNYNFKYPKRNYLIFLENYNNPKKKILKINKIFKPDIIFFCGYRLRFISFFKKINLTKNVKYFFWLERFNKENKIKFFIIKNSIQYFLKNSKGLFAIGKEARNFYLKFNKNVFNIPYSIKIPKKKIVKEKSKKTHFLFVGQLINRKGIDILINCIKRLKDKNNLHYNITIIGNGKYKTSVKKLVKENSNIKFMPFMGQKKLIQQFKKSDVLLFPSKFDGWGVVPMQAMSYSMYIVIGNNCGVNEIIKKNNNKIINVNEDKLLDIIEYCCKNKSEIVKKGGVNYYSIRESICNIDKSIILFNKAIAKY